MNVAKGDDIKIAISTTDDTEQITTPATKSKLSEKSRSIMRLGIQAFIVGSRATVASAESPVSASSQLETWFMYGIRVESLRKSIWRARSILPEAA